MEMKYSNCPPDASEDKKRNLFEKALDVAMAQIRDRGYADKYKGSGKSIYKECRKRENPTIPNDMDELP